MVIDNSNLGLPYGVYLRAGIGTTERKLRAGVMVVACIYDDSGTWQFLKPALQVFMLSISYFAFMYSRNVCPRRVYHFAKFSAEVGSETENIFVMEKSIPLMPSRLV